MSHELNLAITLPEQPLIFAAPVIVIVVILAIVVLRKSRRKKAMVRSWGAAGHELGLDLVSNASDLGPVASGKVNSHVVSIAPTAGSGRKGRTSTQYSVKFEAPEAPRFRLVKRTNTDVPIIDTGNPKFDAVVAVQTDQPVLLGRFLTASRRAAILRLLTYWPTAEISNREAHLRTPGIEKDTDKLVDSICHLVATAETFDRPTARDDAPDAAAFSGPAAPSTTAPAPAAAAATAEDGFEDTTDQSVVDANGVVVEHDENLDDADADETADADVAAVAGPGSASDDIEQFVNGDGDVLTEVRLDEVTVLNDLFNSGLDAAAIDGRFQQVYQGREVAWTGEVVRVAPIDGRGRQRIAAFIGSADGQNPESGRVVALTAVASTPVLTAGDVVTFSGALVNLDASQRLFHVA